MKNFAKQLYIYQYVQLKKSHLKPKIQITKAKNTRRAKWLMINNDNFGPHINQKYYFSLNKIHASATIKLNLRQVVPV